MTRGAPAGLTRGRYLALIAAAAAAYAAVVAGVGPRLMDMAAPLAVFDLRPLGYGLAEAQALLNRIGAEGRQYYATVVVPVDMVFAVLFTVCLAATVLRYAPRAGLVVVVLAAAPGLFDIAENLALRAMLRGDPADLSAGLVLLASTLTTLKFAALVPTVALILWLILRKRQEK